MVAGVRIHPHQNFLCWNVRMGKPMQDLARQQFPLTRQESAAALRKFGEGASLLLRGAGRIFLGVIPFFLDPGPPALLGGPPGRH